MLSKPKKAWTNNRHMFDREWPRKCMVCGYVRLTIKPKVPCTHDNRTSTRNNFKPPKPN